MPINICALWYLPYFVGCGDVSPGWTYQAHLVSVFGYCNPLTSCKIIVSPWLSRLHQKCLNVINSKSLFHIKAMCYMLVLRWLISNDRSLIGQGLDWRDIKSLIMEECNDGVVRDVWRL